MGYLCIQEILVLTKSSVRPPLYVSESGKAHLLARSLRHVLSVFNLVLDIYEMAN